MSNESFDMNTILQLIKQNIGWFFATFVEILSQPKKRFATLQSRSQILNAKKGSKTESHTDLSSQVWIFGLFNILAGTLMFGDSIDLAVGTMSKIVVGTLVCWTVYSTLLHGLCRLLGGVNIFERTLSVSIQVLSVAFFLSSFVGFIATRALEFLKHQQHDYHSDEGFLTAIGICFAAQSVLLIVYWTLSLRSVHRLAGWAPFVFIPLAVVLFMILNFILFGALFLSGIPSGGFTPHT